MPSNYTQQKSNTGLCLDQAQGQAPPNTPVGLQTRGILCLANTPPLRREPPGLADASGLFVLPAGEPFGAAELHEAAGSAL